MYFLFIKNLAFKNVTQPSKRLKTEVTSLPGISGLNDHIEPTKKNSDSAITGINTGALNSTSCFTSFLGDGYDDEDDDMDHDEDSDDTINLNDNHEDKYYRIHEENEDTNDYDDDINDTNEDTNDDYDDTNGF